MKISGRPWDSLRCAHVRTRERREGGGGRRKWRRGGEKGIGGGEGSVLLYSLCYNV